MTTCPHPTEHLEIGCHYSSIDPSVVWCGACKTLLATCDDPEELDQWLFRAWEAP